jgi:Zn-dependent protease with chaperone function
VKTLLLCPQYRGVEQLVARWAHNPKVVSSSLTPATLKIGAPTRYWGFFISMRSILTLLTFLVVFGQQAFGQHKKSFTPSPFYDTIPTALLSELKTQLLLENEKITASGRVKNFVKSVHEKRLEFIVKNINDDYFFSDQSELTRYLRSITNKIYQANPELAERVTVYAHRSTSVNAISFGNGTVAMMIGLLERLENEDQVAFVLCHELAHYHYKHSQQSIQQLAELNYDKGLKKKLDEVNKSEYGRYTKLRQLFEGLDLSFNKHSRNHEFEADSLGLLLYINAGYDKNAPLRVIEILEGADQEFNSTPILFNKIFDFKGFPFKESWIQYEKSDVWHAPKKYADSDTAQTHPNCERRMQALIRQLQRIGKENVAVPAAGKNQIENITLQASLEIIESEYHFKKYGKAIYKALVLLNKYPDNAYLHAMVAKCLFKIHESQKKHEFGKTVELPDPRFSENYDRLLTFIHKLRLSEMANLAYHYSISQKEECFSDEEYLYAFWLCSSLEESKIDSDKVRDDYVQKFPAGRYTSIISKQ